MEGSNEIIQNAKSGIIMKNNDYISILIQSLHKKIDILDKIIQINADQKQLLEDEDFSIDKFTNSIKNKSGLVEKLDLLDSGFGEVYNRVKDELVFNKDSYTSQIHEMKTLIQQITDKSVMIRVEEERNKSLFVKKTAAMKQEISKRRISSKVANEYYRKMANLDYTDAHFMDKKK
jgi:flagellar biosynthesis/type III secretory pathway chaperone